MATNLYKDPDGVYREGHQAYVTPDPRLPEAYHRLYGAMIRRATRDLNARNPTERLAAEAWFSTEQYEAMADALGLDPSCLRKRLFGPGRAQALAGLDAYAKNVLQDHHGN